MNTALSGSSGSIVVGVDGSDQSVASLRWAAEEAAIRREALRIVTVWSTPVVSMPAPTVGYFIDPALFEADGERIVQDAAASIRADMGSRAPEIATSVLQGVPIPQLLAASADASLLVLGSRGRGGFASLLLGSVALGCTHHATIPVAVIHHPDVLPGSGDVVVGVDDSDGARHALRWAALEAARWGCRLVVVHAWETPHAAPSGGSAFGPLIIKELIRESEQLLERLIADALDGIENPPTIEKRSVPLGAVEALLGEAKGASLLVVGSRGRGGFAGLVMGSVSQQCVYHSPCPVIAVPEGVS